MELTTNITSEVAMNQKDKVLSTFILSDVQKNYVASLPLRKMGVKSYWISMAISSFIFFMLIFGGLVAMFEKPNYEILWIVMTIASLGIFVTYLNGKMTANILDGCHSYLRNLPSNNQASSYELLEARLVSYLEALNEENSIFVKIGFLCWGIFIVGCLASGVVSHMVCGVILAGVIGCNYFFKSRCNHQINVMINTLVPNPWLAEDVVPTFPMAKWHDDKMIADLESIRQTWRVS